MSRALIIRQEVTEGVLEQECSKLMSDSSRACVNAKIIFLL